MIYTIYKATNLVNGKVYIGFDSNWPNRIKEHKKDHKRKDKQCRFYSAIKKYGFDNFSWDVLYQSKDQCYTLTEMENYFISEYRSYIGFDDCNGYNMTLGGGGTIGKSHTQEWKENHSLIMTGRKFTTEHKQNISSSLKGRTFSDETKQKIKIANSGINNWQTKKLGSLHPKSKKYIGISPNNEIIIIHGMRDFCRKNNLNQGVAIQSVKKSSTHKGWKFYNYDETLLIKLTEELYEN
jgi:group I intron endonuclease